MKKKKKILFSDNELNWMTVFKIKKESSQIDGYKNSIQILIVFLYSNNSLLKKMHWTETPFSKANCFIVLINLTKYV